MRFETGLAIRRPVEEVFEFVSDFSHLPLWNYYILSTTPEDSGPTRVGLRYRQTRKTDTQHFEVCEYVPHRLAAIRMLPPTMPAMIRFAFRPIDQGTWLSDEWSLRTPIPIPGFVTGMITRPVKAAVEQNLGKLKTLLETGAVELQDGRRIQR
ncbi:MAG: SRPBCC family protein [Hyphomonadaceae bacterium]